MIQLLVIICSSLVGVIVLLTAIMWKNRKKTDEVKFKNITKMIFVTTQISALIWVFTSYGIAVYATIVLGQVYTMAELSEPAINTLLGVGIMKVIENIFEHNSGSIFGTSDNTQE